MEGLPRLRCLLAILVLALLSLSCGGSEAVVPAPAPQPEKPLKLALEQVVTGLANPVDLQEPPDSSGRLFVIEQPGTIRIIQAGTLVSMPFLDITSRVASGGEMGLLGLAFHPDFAQNRRFFVDYTSTAGGTLHTVIAEYHASGTNPNLADPAERVILTVDQPYENHNGGQIVFGPDGFLYIALGDGGSGGDPLGNGQSLSTLLGKLLRIDVGSAPYAVPPDNPFVGQAGMDEIWAYGLRNPWRFSFDRGTGRLFLADVGQSDFEEVDIVTRGGNYGWGVMEGNHCYPPPSATCDMTGLTLPIAEYGHDEGDSITGGFVYRGPLITRLRGTYVLGDFISGNIWGLSEDSPGVWSRSLLLASGLNISSFGQDGAGELYVLDYNGTVYRLRAAP